VWEQLRQRRGETVYGPDLGRQHQSLFISPARGADEGGHDRSMLTRRSAPDPWSAPLQDPFELARERTALAAFRTPGYDDGRRLRTLHHRSEFAPNEIPQGLAARSGCLQKPADGYAGGMLL
jgi:hypothetical protein